MADHRFLCWLVRIREAGSSMRLHWLLWISWRLGLPEVNLSYLCAIITYSPKNKIFLFLFLSTCNLGLPNNLPVRYIVVQSPNIFCYFKVSEEDSIFWESNKQKVWCNWATLNCTHFTAWKLPQNSPDKSYCPDEIMSAAADQCVRLQVHMACLCTLCAQVLRTPPGVGAHGHPSQQPQNQHGTASQGQPETKSQRLRNHRTRPCQPSVTIWSCLGSD